MQVMYNLYVTVKGNVRPCSSIHVEVANVKNNKLAEIIEMPFFNLARNIDKNLTGKCKNCENNSECVGCRGLTYAYGKNNGKDPMAALCMEDPSCFK